MSYWTQTSILFKVKGKLSVSDIEKLVGHIYSWQDMITYNIKYIHPEDDNSNYFLPMGSEGTLEIYIKKTTENNTVFWIGGGLRNRTSIDDITTWFNRVIANNQNFDREYLILKATGYAQSDLGEAEKYNYHYHYAKAELLDELKWRWYKLTHFWYYK